MDQMAVSQNIEKNEYLNDAGSVTMFLELKPHKGQGLRNQRGREYATGVYVLRGAVRSTAVLLCDTPNAKRGEKITYSTEILQNFGFRRE